MYTAHYEHYVVYEQYVKSEKSAFETSEHGKCDVFIKFTEFLWE